MKRTITRLLMLTTATLLPLAAWAGGKNPLPPEKVPAFAAPWRVVRVDLWDVFKRPVRIERMTLTTRGGAAAFDRILLARTESNVTPTARTDR